MAKITDDVDELLAFYGYPASLDSLAHHESDLGVHVRDGAASDEGHQGTGWRAAGLAMAFTLIESAQSRWRAVNVPYLVALVRAGTVFVNGALVQRPDEEAT